MSDVELYVGGDWVDVVDDDAEADGAKDSVTVKRGYDSENSNVAPANCTLTVNNRDGTYSPRNPLSPYFGSLGRNTPVRVAAGLLGNSTFETAAANGWSATDDGLAWTLSGSGGTVQNSDWQVTGGKGTMSVPAVGYRRARLADVVYVDCEVAVDVTVPVSDVTGGTLEPACLEFRGVGSAYYLLRVSITTAEAVTLAVELDDGTVITAPVTVPDLTHSSGQTLRVKAHLEGPVLRAKVWAATSTEPHSWHLRSVDPDSTYTAGGFVSLRSGRGTGNTDGTVVFSYDNLVIRNPRFCGEVGTWPVRWDVSGGDPMVSIEAAGVLRRMAQGASPVHSVLYRAITSLPASARLLQYWPAEDESGASVLASAIPGGRAMGIAFAEASLSSYTGFPGSGGIPTLNDSEWTGTIPTYTATGTIVLRFLLRMPAVDEVATGQGLVQLFTTGTAARWDLQYQAGGDLQLRAFNSAGTQLYASSVIALSLQDNPVMVSIELVQSGSNVSWSVDTLTLAGGIEAGGGTATGVTIGRATKVLVNPQTGYDDVAVGHIHVQAAITDLGDLAGHMRAFSGESAGARIARVCDEAGVTFTQIGEDSTTTLGPQGSGDPLSLIEEAVAADLGYLYEPRGDIGLEYRTRPSLWNQTPKLPLNYSADHLSEAPPPIDDDRYSRNDWTVTRSGGSSARYTVDEGPMSTQAPPDGIGRYQESATVNVDSDDQLLDQAAFRAAVGTINEPRFPSVPINLAKPEVAADPAILAAALATNVGDRLTIDNASEADFYDQISQIVIGYTETITPVDHLITFVTVPEAPHQVMQLDDEDSRLDSDSSSLLIDVGTGNTIIPVVTEPAGTLWATRTGIATATEDSLGGTYIKCVDADATDINVGDECTLYSPLGALLGDVHEVTLKTSVLGFTKIDFTPATAPGWPTTGSTLRAFPAGRFPVPLRLGPDGGERYDVYDINPQGPQLISVGTASHVDNLPVTPAMPGTWSQGDLLLLVAASQSTGGGIPDTPAGWEKLLDLSNTALFGRIAQVGDTAPTVTFTGTGGVGQTRSGQIAAFRGATTTVWASSTQLNGSVQNIAFPFLAVPMDRSLVIALGWKQDDWTSVSTPAPFTEIAEPSTTVGNDHGFVWGYQVQTALENIAAGTFTVTGGASAVSRSGVVALSGNVQFFAGIRSVNGVSMSHSAGAQARLYQPRRLGL